MTAAQPSSASDPARVPDDDAARDDLIRHLRLAREALVWKLEGLGEHDIRRPLVPTGSNLLGLVKHAAGVEAGYLGFVFGRPFPEQLPWMEEDAPPNADMRATAEESRADIVGLSERVGAHSEATLRALPLDAVGRVPWWPGEAGRVTVRRIAVHLVAELNRHAGHADVLRELVDGAAGLRPDSGNLPEGDAAFWRAEHAETARVARVAAGLPPVD
ncbi:DinB family protein [Clavibacter michiganensis]|uniref:DinB family protein n=1 Tax=Clavibacter michiganensis TaxID=28447 RepID=UPI001365DC0A|nr:DinB family protein [Clavibacter michiganensis]MDO4018551.1 DinB family protein [Clavibacter michiganensis]MDO4037839.1 DinB family protein [Clavibacter michiganensis]MDO4040253.1 DinB family protein [Clavibacter michiganensis]MDO4049691.1 DinB family protein [Clavibacter michiganensis]MDO4062939.1 DinB family protein [Clavibacter michiganensis]